MDILKKSGDIVDRVLDEYYQISYSYGDLERRFVVSEDGSNYLLITHGQMIITSLSILRYLLVLHSEMSKIIRYR